MNKWSADQIRTQINKAMPEGSVIAVHNEKGHFYKIMTPDENGAVGNVYSSVTSKLQILKDESLINYKMNQAIQYVFRKYKEFNDSNIMEHLDIAARTSVDILTDAGDIGNEIHEARERYFKDWIKTGVRPADILNYIPSDNPDIRMKSALRALQTFVLAHSYVPIMTELFVYSHKLKVGGTLDDLGLMRKVVREGDPNCVHNTKFSDVGNSFLVGNHCVKCDYKFRTQFVLMDIKTSNQFKDHYFFQVALYNFMFYRLTGLRPQRCFILKLSKEDGTYKLEDLVRPSTLGAYARSMIRTHNGIQYIRELRKDNQKVVGEMLQI